MLNWSGRIPWTYCTHVTDFVLYFAVDVFVRFNNLKMSKKVIFIFLQLALTEKHIKNL